MSKPPVIVWFRQDLRLDDNPALSFAVGTGHPVLPVYILDDENSGEWAMGGASRWWLHESLKTFNESLDGNLYLYKGDPSDIIKNLIKDLSAHGIYWNRCYEPWRIKRDKALKEDLKKLDIEVKSFNGSLLFESHTTLKEDGNPYKVFTPFYKRGCLQRSGEPRSPEERPSNIEFFTEEGLSLDKLELLPSHTWYEKFEKYWTPGEFGARERLCEFIDGGLKGYKEGRNYPDKPNVSRLSPHLHFGEISPHTVWHAARKAMVAQGCESDGEHFLSELGWREFSNNLLYYFPEMPRKNLQEKFDGFTWRDDPKSLECWKKGQTGYPIVDAGMRELWETGYMHNRVRMIAGSFLVKNLMIHWHQGERWFWDTLVDADLANNSASWQWIAGCGADAAPYFRIFNPITQSKKFDEQGSYIRRYIPELKNMPDKYIHAPWEAPDSVLFKAKVILGESYPHPIVDLKTSRERALEEFKSL